MQSSIKRDGLQNQDTAALDTKAGAIYLACLSASLDLLMTCTGLRRMNVERKMHVVESACHGRKRRRWRKQLRRRLVWLRAYIIISTLVQRAL